MIFGMLLGGAGGMGWVPVASESAESDLRVCQLFAHARLPLRGCGEYLRRLRRVIAAPPITGNSARASSVCASAEVSGCWVGMRSEVVLGTHSHPTGGHLGGHWGAIGIRTLPKPQKFKKALPIFRRFLGHFGVLEASKIALIV